MAGSTVGVAGVTGAGPNVRILVQKVCGAPGCYTSAIVNAIRAAADYPGMVAMNLSLGGTTISRAEKDDMNAAIVEHFAPVDMSLAEIEAMQAQLSLLPPSLPMLPDLRPEADRAAAATEVAYTGSALSLPVLLIATPIVAVLGGLGLVMDCCYALLASVAAKRFSGSSQRACVHFEFGQVFLDVGNNCA